MVNECKIIMFILATCVDIDSTEDEYVDYTDGLMILMKWLTIRKTNNAVMMLIMKKMLLLKIRLVL